MRLAFLTPAQAAAQKGCSLQAIHLAIKEGRLRAYLIGGGKEINRYLISHFELSQYMPRKYQKRKHWPQRRRKAGESIEAFNARCRPDQQREETP